MRSLYTESQTSETIENEFLQDGISKLDKATEHIQCLFDEFSKTPNPESYYRVLLELHRSEIYELDQSDFTEACTKLINNGFLPVIALTHPYVQPLFYTTAANGTKFPWSVHRHISAVPILIDPNNRDPVLKSISTLSSPIGCLSGILDQYSTVVGNYPTGTTNKFLQNWQVHPGLVWIYPGGMSRELERSNPETNPFAKGVLRVAQKLSELPIVNHHFPNGVKVVLADQHNPYFNGSKIVAKTDFVGILDLPEISNTENFMDKVWESFLKFRES